MTSGASRAAIAFIIAATACSLEPVRRRVDSLPELGYPSCEGQPPPAGEVIAQGFLRSGPTSREPDVVERFEIRRRGCLFVGTLHQEWALSVIDVDMVWDRNWSPLRAWKRTGLPGSRGAIEHFDIERHELRSDPVGLLRRGRNGEIERFHVRGAPPRAVVTPGRGLLTAWLRRAHLAVGQRSREPVLDVRESISQIADVTLERLPDEDIEGLGSVRVYTIFGREPILADAHDTVIGDVFGLRPDSILHTPRPAPMASLPPPNPAGAP